MTKNYSAQNDNTMEVERVTSRTNVQKLLLICYASVAIRKLNKQGEKKTWADTELILW